MIAVTLHEAKAKLNKLVEVARGGEQVVLLRGSEVVAALTPLDAGDLEIASHLTDDQARRFWEEVEARPGKFCSSPDKAVAHLRKLKSRA